MNVSRLEFGRSSISSDPEAGLLLSLNKSNLSVTADWKYKIETSFRSIILRLLKLDKFSDEGSLVALVNGVQLRVGLFVRADDQGHPRIETSSCRFEVDTLNVTFTGDSR
jgi:hypothetical protein